MWEPERREADRYPRAGLGQQLADVLGWFPAHPNGTTAIAILAALVVIWRLITPGVVRLGDLRPGDCIFVRTAAAVSPIDPGPGDPASARAAILADGAERAPCDAPHSHEVSGLVDLGPGATPVPPGADDRGALLAFADAACAAGLPAYLGLPAGVTSTAHAGFAVVPDERLWEGGTRMAACLIAAADGRFLAGPAKGSGR